MLAATSGRQAWPLGRPRNWKKNSPATSLHGETAAARRAG